MHTTSAMFLPCPQYAQREASVEGDVTKKDVWLARLRQLDRAGKDTRAELRKVSPSPPLQAPCSAPTKRPMSLPCAVLCCARRCVACWTVWVCLAVCRVLPRLVVPRPSSSPTSQPPPTTGPPPSLQAPPAPPPFASRRRLRCPLCVCVVSVRGLREDAVSLSAAMTQSLQRTRGLMAQELERVQNAMSLMGTAPPSPQHSTATRNTGSASLSLSVCVCLCRSR